MSEQPQPIGVIASDLGGYYFGAMIRGMHQAARSASVPLIVIQQALGDLALPSFGSNHVAGWIVIHPSEDDRTNLAALCAEERPVVMVPVPLEGMPCTLVQVDNRGGMCAAVLHLIDHGHQRIAYVDHGPESWSEQRYQGYCDALDARGIAHDSALVIHMGSPKRDDIEIHQERGEYAAQYLLERGLPCTALAASTDTCALAAMRVVQAAGYRVPDDLAVVGFDDILESQYASPPLTTVRSPFDAIGRAAALQLLAEIRGGRAALPQIISMPTPVLHRRSCGCTTLDERLAADAVARNEPTSWQATLIQQLVQVVRYPLPLDPAIPPEQLWPGAGVLVAAIDATLTQQQQESTGIELAWQQAIAQTENLEALHAALTLLEDTAEQRMATMPSAEQRPAVVTLLRRMRLELSRARLAYEIAPKQLLNDQVRTNYAVSMALLGSSSSEAQALGWLERTPAIWGCLGLWDDAHGAGAAMLTIAGVYQRDVAPSNGVGQHVAATVFPPLCQLPLSAQQGQDLTILCPIRTRMRDWGVLALCGWANQSLITDGMEILHIQANLLGATLDRDSVLAALTQARAAAEQANTFKSQFLSTMSHELRTPLNAIRNFSRFLNKESYGPLTARQTDLQQRILANADHLLGLLNDILDLSKIEAGRMDLFVEPTALRPILQGVLTTIGGLAKDKGLSLTLEAADDLPVVIIDKTRIRQVLLNLLANAVKFTEQGGISVRAAPTDEGMVCISVTDSGIGIAPAHQALVFEEFRQVEGVQHAQQGTGLGLPISKRLVELHGGRLWLSSTPGQGATFAFTVPIDPAAQVT